MIFPENTFLEHVSSEKASGESLSLLLFNGNMPTDDAILYQESASPSLPAPTVSDFSTATLRFLLNELRSAEMHYVLLLTKDRRPILASTAVFRYGGLCLFTALQATAEEVVAFLATMPSIRYAAAPDVDALSESVPDDPAVFARLGITFRRIFSLFESVYVVPAEYTDPLALFRTMQMKLRNAAALFGIQADFLFSNAFAEPLRKHLLFDLDLFSATVLLLFSAVRLYALEQHVRIVFMEADLCPAVCVHFRVDSERYKSSELRETLDRIYIEHSSFFDACMGEHARKEAEKIPGIGHMILHDRYASFGDHVLNVFVPIRRSWADFALRCPLPILPDRFYEGLDELYFSFNEQ